VAYREKLAFSPELAHELQIPQPVVYLRIGLGKIIKPYSPIKSKENFSTGICIFKATLLGLIFINTYCRSIMNNFAISPSPYSDLGLSFYVNKNPMHIGAYRDTVPLNCEENNEDLKEGKVC
jgi:hypothetical protein